MKCNRSSETGSVLYYIFIGIALFAALSFAVANSMRGSGSSINRELLALQASEIMQYTNGLQRSIRIMRIDGLEYTNLSFENNIIAGYTNGTCDSCELFHGDGGSMAYQVPQTDWLDTSQLAQTFYGEWYFPGQVCVEDIGSDTGTGCSSDSASNEEVVVILPWIKENLCVIINEDLGVTVPGDAIPQEASHGWNTDNRKFTGVDSDGEILNQSGLRQGCFEGSGAITTPPEKTYHYFHVMWPR